MHIYKCLQEPVSQEQSPSHQVPSLDDPDIRADLVQRVRAEIAEGTYATPEKFEMALDRLIREIR
jgi:hypothetical protein